MAWANDSIADIFPGATVVSGDVKIPSGTVTSFVPSSVTDPGASEFVFGMLETMHHAVSGAQLTNLTSTSTTSLVDDGTVLLKNYTYSVRLDFGVNTLIDNLNVKDEPSA